MDTRSFNLQDEYQRRFQANASYRESVWKILCRDFFSKYIAPSYTVLDLGAGWGEFSRNVSAAKKFAMDLNPECGQRVDSVATFLYQDCSTAWPLSDETLDIVFTSNFLEHLPSKEHVDSTLAEAFRCLKPGGKLICLGPNIKYIQGAYWDFWDHFIPITELSMAESLSLRGFHVTERIARFLPYSMSTGKNPPLLAIKIYLKIPLAWRLFGKQFLVVAQKP